MGVKKRVWKKMTFEFDLEFVIRDPNPQTFEKSVKVDLETGSEGSLS